MEFGGRTGRFLLRAEEIEASFIREMGERPPCDGLVISAAYLAEYPAGRRRRGDPRALSDAAQAVGLDWRADPATAAFAHVDIGRRLGPRAANSPYARAIELPVRVSTFDRSGQAEAWVESGVECQLSARGFAAPYLEVDDRRGPELSLDCELIRLAAERSTDGEVVAYLQVTRKRLLDGTAEHAALEFIAAGATTVFIRIRRFKPEESDLGGALRYMRLVAAITRAGGRAVPDCVGRLGPALLPAGAFAFSTNVRRFRKLPDDLATRAGGSSPPVPWEVPGQMYHLTPGNMHANAGRCDHPDCEARDGEGPPRARRAHCLHEFQGLARQAGREGLAFADTMSRVEGRQARVWAEALREFQGERRAA